MQKWNKRLAFAMVCLLIIAGVVALLGQKAAEMPVGDQGLRITEICAKNDSLIADSLGRTPDYIELYNPGEALDVTGFVFSNGEVRSAPLAGVIPAGAYRVFFLREEDAGFSLSASGGEEISLLDDDGNLIARAQTQTMAADEAMLLVGGVYRVSGDASPGFSNDEQGLSVFRNGIKDEEPRLLLSEVLASNQNIIPDENGVFSDAVELYNSSNSAISLQEYWLSDDLAQRFAWQLPALSLQPGEYLVVFCDGESYVSESGEIHAPFSLSRSDTLVLTDHQGFCQSLVLEQSQENTSLAFVAGEYVSMQPSLGYENTQAGVQTMAFARIDWNSPLMIQEVLFSDSGIPWEGKLQDVVEIVNRSGETVSTQGWYLSDGKDPYAYPLPEMLLQPGQIIRLACHKDTTGFAISKGESVCLTGPKGVFAPAVAWTESEQGKSLHLLYAGEEMTAAWGAVSLGYENTRQGAESFLQQTLPSGLRISEVMSANYSYLADSNGKTCDWLELYNASNQTLSLSDYALTDDPSYPDRHPLPDVTLAPGEYWTVILSSDKDVSSRYHVLPMGLSSQGDALYLTRGERLEDYTLIPALPTDMTYGRGQGSAAFSYLNKPTPGKANTSGAELSAMPVAVTAQGCYNGVEYVDVELSAPGPIYYTTDAEAPGANATLYTGPIRITRNTVIRAQCRELGKQPSQVLDLTYLLNQGDQLSVVTVVADPTELLSWGGIYYNFWVDMEIPATVSLFEAEGGGFTESCGLRMFGGYTRAYDKKSFACMFRDRYGAPSLQYPLFGEDNLQEFQAFVLRTGGQDSIKGRIRDEMITSLVAQYTDVPVQDYRPVTLYLNGRFWGVYFVREKVNEDYIAGHYNVPAEDVIIQFGNGNDPEYRSLIHYVRTHDLSVQEHYDYVAQRIDIDEFIDYHAVQMWTGNVDMGNIKYFKLPDGKWTWILYDTDLALTMADYNSVVEQLNPAGTGADDLFSTDLIVGLMKNPQFREKFLRRMAWQAETIWNTPQLMEKIAYLENMIRPDMERDIARWGESLDFWNAKLGYMRYVVENRGRFVYYHIRSYFHLSDSKMQELGFSKP